MLVGFGCRQYPQTHDRAAGSPALGITQIFAWGSTFYLPAALAPLIASDTGWPYDLTVGGVSARLLIAGLASPSVGHLIADKGLSWPSQHCCWRRVSRASAPRN